MLTSVWRTWYMCEDILTLMFWYMSQVKKQTFLSNQRSFHESLKPLNLRANTGLVKIGFCEVGRAGYGLCHESCTHAREDT